MIKQLPVLLALLVVAYSARAEVYVQAVEVLINEDAQVMAGRYSYYDLTLTQGEVLIVDLQVVGGLDNSLTIWLLDLANFQRYKAGQQYNYFEGSSGNITSSSSYRFEVPEANVYYLVLDNPSKFATRTARTYAYKITEGETEESKQTKEFYSGLYDEFLKKLFIFDDFDISVEMCGTENAFSSPHILICYELNNLLFRQNVPEAIYFVFLHESAHSLLNVWDYPLHDNEDAADELATVLLLLVEDKAAALDAAKWWANSGSNEEALSKLWIDDRHTISPQRARNIINWINNEDELTRRWLNLLIPKMTDEALQAFVDENFKGMTQVIQQELVKRQAIKGE